MESSSEEFRVHCSEAAARLVAEQDPAIKLCQRGKIPIKGKGTMSTYWIIGASGPANGARQKSSGQRGASSVAEVVVEEEEQEAERAEALEASAAEAAGDAAPALQTRAQNSC